MTHSKGREEEEKVEVSVGDSFLVLKPTSDLFLDWLRLYAINSMLHAKEKRPEHGAEPLNPRRGSGEAHRQPVAFVCRSILTRIGKGDNVDVQKPSDVVGTQCKEAP